MTARPRSSARRAALFGAALLSGLLSVTGLSALAGGCRQAISFEDRELDPTLADGGDGGGETPLTCEGYCGLIQEVCTGPNAQFGSLEACKRFCQLYPEGTRGDTSGNTLACRIQRLESAKAMPEGTDCAAGGPGGNGECGTNCDAYCTGMLALCTDKFESLQQCQDACAPLIECGPYAVTADTPDDPSIQCRLYHLTAAAVGYPDQDPQDPLSTQFKHCPHAAGETECIDQADPMCP